MTWFEPAGIVLVALLLDALIGDPHWLYDRVPHPAVLLGRSIDWLEGRLSHANRPPEAQRRRGMILVVVLLALVLVIGVLIRTSIHHFTWGWLIEAALMSTLISQRSLVLHVQAVADALGAGIETARSEVAKIVGRDVQELDEPAVCRAAIESLAENQSDGVVALVFWGLLLGLPGALIYKAINTADSMIGYRNERYEHFGKAAARLDDFVNWLPARLTALLIALVAHQRPKLVFTITRRDAPLHKSPNAGWPEATMAAALDLRLGGPRRYGEAVVDGAWLGSGRPDATEEDINRAVGVSWWVWAVIVVLLLLAALMS